MKFQTIYNSAVKLFPKTIDISDGYLLEETGGCMFPSLSKAWEKAENQISDDEWGNLMIWVIYQFLHNKAKKKLQSRDFSSISINEISLPIIKANYIKALDSEDYSDMKKEFLRKNKS